MTDKDNYSATAKKWNQNFSVEKKKCEKFIPMYERFSENFRVGLFHQ